MTLDDLIAEAGEPGWACFSSDHGRWNCSLQSCKIFNISTWVNNQVFSAWTTQHSWLRLAFQTQADIPSSLCVSYIQISSNFTWCPAHTRKTLPCALRGSREMAPKTIMNCLVLDQDAMRLLSPSRQHGWSSSRCQQRLAGTWGLGQCLLQDGSTTLPLDPTKHRGKSSQSVQGCSAQLPHPACSWYIPKFPAYILHAGPVSPAGFCLRCWECPWAAPRTTNSWETSMGNIPAMLG